MSKSALEAKFALAWRMLGPSEPEIVHEHVFHPDRRWRFDFAFPDAKLAVEIDGGQWAPHGGRHSRDSDREKLNAAAVLGWRVLRYSGTMLKDPESVVAEIVVALEGKDAVDV
jgi:very-short-patch-repair endonuclease